MVDAKKMRCERCKKLVYISDIKISDRDGVKVPFCKTCLAQSEFSKIEQKVPSSDPTKMPFYCGRCKYKFRVNPKKTSITCPYCGKPDKVVEQKEVSTDSLVNEVQ